MPGVAVPDQITRAVFDAAAVREIGKVRPTVA
jgi:hypothetical protein